MINLDSEDILLKIDKENKEITKEFEVFKLQEILQKGFTRNDKFLRIKYLQTHGLTQKKQNLLI